MKLKVSQGGKYFIASPLSKFLNLNLYLVFFFQLYTYKKSQNYPKRKFNRHLYKISVLCPTTMSYPSSFFLLDQEWHQLDMKGQHHKLLKSHTCSLNISLMRYHIQDYEVFITLVLVFLHANMFYHLIHHQ